MRAPASAPSFATVPRGSRTGADLMGWSALPLLARATDSRSPWLFVATPSLGWVSGAAVADAQFVQAPAEYDRSWPFGEGEIGGVVIDGDALAREASEPALRRILAEANRVSGRGGNVLVACGHRLVPRRLQAWREYGRPSARRWRRAAALLGLPARTAAFLRIESDRLAEVTHAPRTGRSSRGGEADRLLLEIGARGPCEGDALDAMVAEAARACGAGLRISRIAVRKIGKTAVFLTAADDRRFIMRIARSPVALARATRNFEALEWLHASSLPSVIKARIPVAVCRGRYAGYRYFVESWLPGGAGPAAARDRQRASRWNMQAAQYITALHRETQTRIAIDDAAMTRLVREPLAIIADGCDSAAARQVLGRVMAVCEVALGRRTVPLVQTHGDFTEANCLFDGNGGLTGVVDWEVSAPRGLPLLDLLQLMPVANESGSHPRWQRFEAWLQLSREPERVIGDPVMGPYVRGLDVAPETIPALILLQWITHVADRLEARREDPRWVRLRVEQPIESLGRMLRD